MAGAPCGRGPAARQLPSQGPSPGSQAQHPSEGSALLSCPLPFPASDALQQLRVYCILHYKRSAPQARSCYPVEALAQLYYARWGIETNFAHLKTTLGLDVLKCKTVDGVLTERIVFALIYNLIRLVMSQAARRQQVDIDRISFIDAARWLAAVRDDEPLALLVVHPHRPSRYEPRVRKRRPKQYSLMQTPRKELRKLLANNTDVD